MDANAQERKIPVYKLLRYESHLKKLRSFSDCVDRCNFKTYAGWRGKLYVGDDGHGVDEYKSTLRGVDVFIVHYLELTDYVILTEKQHKDYKTIAGMDSY